MPVPPERQIPVWMSVPTGTHRKPEELLQALYDSGCTVTQTATEMVHGLRLLCEERTAHLTCATYKDLRLPKGIPYGRIRNAAADYGCIECAQEVGPQLRRQHLQQPTGQRLIIMALPMRIGEQHLLFTVQYFPLQHPLAGFCLDAIPCNEQFQDSDILVFAVPPVLMQM